MGKKERRDDFSAVVKGRTEGARGMKNRLILVTCLSPGNRLISRPGLLPRATSVFMVLQELGLLPSMPHVAEKPGVWTATCGQFGV